MAKNVTIAIGGQEPKYVRRPVRGLDRGQMFFLRDPGALDTNDDGAACRNLWIVTDTPGSEEGCCHYSGMQVDGSNAMRLNGDGLVYAAQATVRAKPMLEDARDLDSCGSYLEGCRSHDIAHDPA